MEQKEPKTTIGDRLSTGAVNGAIGGVAMGGMFAVINGVTKLFNKSSKFAFSPMQWKITGGVAALGMAYGFFTANKAEENKREAYIENTIADANNPANHYSPKQREEMISSAISDTMDGKIPANSNSTKFRDKVHASRAPSASHEIGA